MSGHSLRKSSFKSHSVACPWGVDRSLIATGSAALSKISKIRASRTSAEIPQPSTVGVKVGDKVVGNSVGEVLGTEVGSWDGLVEGASVIMIPVCVAGTLGAFVEATVGDDVGIVVGREDGT